MIKSPVSSLREKYFFNGALQIITMKFKSGGIVIYLLLTATNTVPGDVGSDTTSDVRGGLHPGRYGLTFRLAEQKP